MSDYITIRNNTVIGNNKSLIQENQADLSNVDSSYNSWYNNIVVAINNGHKNTAILNTNYDNVPNQSNIWKNNISYNGKPGQSSTQYWGRSADAIGTTLNKLGVDPKLVKTYTLSPDTTNFVPRNISLAINYGDIFNSPTQDFYGKTRDSLPDAGAIEYFK